MTDSTLVMEKMIPPPGTYPARDLGFSEPPHLPYSVAVDSIESISQVRRASGAIGPLVLIGVPLVAVLIGLQLVDEAEFE